MAGYLDVEDVIPDSLSSGIFSSPGNKFSAIIRLSDFGQFIEVNPSRIREFFSGDDHASVRLGRLALKIAYRSKDAESCDGIDEVIEVPELDGARLIDL